jgi:carbon storage regulator
MLVLSRKKAERIFLANGKIKIMVLDIRGDSVRIGIDAPKDIDIHREEVFDLIQKEGSNKQQKED